MAVNRITIRDKHGNVLFRNTFAGVDKVNVSVAPGTGVPEAESSYSNGELSIILKNIKGNGINSFHTVQESLLDGGTSTYRITDELGNSIDINVQNGHRGNGITDIQTTERQGDEAENDVTIKTTENPDGYTFHVRNGSRGNGIDHLEENISHVDGQPNTHTLHYTDGRMESFHTYNGGVGPKGASAVFDPETGNILAMLESTIGNNDANAMTQEAVTKEIERINTAIGVVKNTHMPTNLEAGTRIVDCTTGVISSSSSQDRYAEVIIISESTYEVSYPCQNFTGNYGYAFVKGDGTFVSGGKDEEGSERTIEREEILTAFGLGARELRITVKDNATSKKGYDVKVIDTAEVKDMASKAYDAINIGTFKRKTNDPATSTQGYFVNSATGALEPSSSTGRYAVEIDIDDSIYDITYNSSSYSSSATKGGYAFLDAENNRIAGEWVRAAGDKTIDHDTIVSALAGGATKIRMGITYTTAKPTYTIRKADSGLRIESIEERLAEVENKNATQDTSIENLDGRVAEIENNKKTDYYNLIGAPMPYVPDLTEETRGTFAKVSYIYTAYDALVTNYPDWFSREEDLGTEGSDSHYPIRHYCLRYQNPEISPDRASIENLWDDDTYKPRRIIINMSVHSMEKYSTLGGYLAIKAILESNEQWAMFIKNNFVLDIIPCFNPWGLENDSSDNHNGVNLNRHYNDTNPEDENVCMMNLVQRWKDKGLIGIIDLHNSSSGGGYLVAKPTYSHYDYYAIFTQQIGAVMNTAFKEVFGDKHWHLWNYQSESGVDQLHYYADKQGLLGCTFEIESAYGLQGSLLTKGILINLIQAFGSYY